MLDSKARGMILDSLRKIALEKGFEQMDSIIGASGRIQHPDLIFKKGETLVIVQIRMYGWKGAEIVGTKSLIPLLFQFEDVKEGSRLLKVKGLVVSPNKFDEEAKILAKKFDMNLLTLTIKTEPYQLNENSMREFWEFLP